MLDPEKPKTKNALTHGVYSSEIVLPGESEEDFIELFNAFRGELNPGTALEEEAVLDLTRLHWLKRRVIKAAKRQFGYQQPVSQTSPLEQRELLTSILSFESKLTRFIQAVHKLQTTISDESEFSEDIKRCSEECEFPMHEIAGYKILFKKILTTRTD